MTRPGTSQRLPAATHRQTHAHVLTHTYTYNHSYKQIYHSNPFTYWHALSLTHTLSHSLPSFTHTQSRTRTFDTKTHHQSSLAAIYAKDVVRWEDVCVYLCSQTDIDWEWNRLSNVDSDLAFWRRAPVTQRHVGETKMKIFGVLVPQWAQK